MNTLKQFRKAKGLTQQDVAEYLNIGRSSYTKYESATHIPDIYILDKLATLFEVTIDELVGRSIANLPKKHQQDTEFLQLVERLQQLPPSDIKEIEAYIEFKHSQKNFKKQTTNIG